MVFLKKDSRGLSLVEILIVMTIIAILISLAAIAYLAQIKKGQDSKRKADLTEIKRAMEDYFNDNGCYPHQSEIDSYFSRCGKNTFSPWLRSIPCDPLYHTPYLIKVEDSQCPGWFAIYVNLEYTSDPQLETNECSDYQCLVNKKIYNFGTSSDNITAGAVDDDGGTLKGGMACKTYAKTVISPGGDCNAGPDNKCLCCTRRCFVDGNCQIPCEVSEEFCNLCH